MSATVSRKLSHYDALWADHCSGHTTIAALAKRHRLTYAAAVRPRRQDAAPTASAYHARRPRLRARLRTKLRLRARRSGG